MLQVVEVELQSSEHLLHGVGVAIVEGGVGGDTRANLVEEAVTRVVLLYLVDVVLALRSRPDERHVADEDVPELWELVEVMVAEEHANLGHAGVFLVPEELRTIFLGIHPHAAELVDIERSPEAPDSFLLEDGWATILPSDEDIADEE